MKKITLLMMLFVASIGLNAQVTIFTESFTGVADATEVSSLSSDVVNEATTGISKITRYATNVVTHTVNTGFATLIPTAGSKSIQGFKVKFPAEINVGDTYIFTAKIKSNTADKVLVRVKFSPVDAADVAFDVTAEDSKVAPGVDTWATYTGKATLNSLGATTIKNATFEIKTLANDQIASVEEWTVSVEKALSNDEITKDDAQLTIYPNPVVDFLTVKASSKVESVQVYNVAGQEVISSTEATVNTASLPKGVYIVKIAQENGAISTKRFIK